MRVKGVSGIYDRDIEHVPVEVQWRGSHNTDVLSAGLF